MPTKARSQPQPTTLMAGGRGSRDFGTTPYLADALRLTGKEKPMALYIGAANGEDRRFGDALGKITKAAGAGEVLWPKLVGRGKSYAQARAALSEAHFVFVGGGDVDAGMQVLQEADLVGELRAAAERGVVFAGMSAGSIMLGERWIRWPHAHSSDADAETYECLGIAPCSLDAHGEEDDWSEARSFATVRARELGKPARAFGVPSGGALVVSHDGNATAHRTPVPVFAALPNMEATIETTLKIAK